MSRIIWTPDALSSEFLRLDPTHIWRLVEAQSRAATMKLVDSLGEQALLEDMLDGSKPPLPVGCSGLHYLLATPFRYDASKPSSVTRFRRKGSGDGVFYAARKVETAVAEMAFYRMLFFAESPKTILPRRPALFTGFHVPVHSARGLDLTVPPLSQDADLWTDKRDYEPCLQLADSARKAGAEIIVAQSVRDPQKGKTVAVLSPKAFAQKEPDLTKQESWAIHLRAGHAVAQRDFPRKSLSFDLADMDDGRLGVYPVASR
ncbi:hypothetical protein GCM10007972_26730 [Iodidimonas muriae]|uniref:RES domain-containing protein n=1 Tax=Iodidimonas muriae TaxID=261467 RepID=A0ABQ2LJ06_9PROT|nr:RES family NAD+ phosphorylase [Iodidimonas muriae]GER08685.1 hypothetical protein JCM17843_29950 [Kordiimonadales bacterium JCM 17843]GGO17014.1 hypothetical protein GCM10007972_26730 [Iodidimonas muriae]